MLKIIISGVTKKVEINSSYVLNADESVTMKATKAIKMSDYNIKAPSFMLGALKTGDDLSISILLKLKSAELQTKN
ncbi:MAG: YceI family protein [Sphingobacteriales bacterium]|nr:YceI family protein [Sphingobacteriales bacterium]